MPVTICGTCGKVECECGNIEQIPRASPSDGQMLSPELLAILKLVKLVADALYIKGR